MKPDGRPLANNNWLTHSVRKELRRFSKEFYAPGIERLSMCRYEGESNENLKSAIKIPNTVRLSCKLTKMILVVWRVADRWQYDAGMQHDGAVVV